MWIFHESDALLDRLARPTASRQHAFLFGAALTAPHPPNSPGVLGVSDVVELIKEHYRLSYPSALGQLSEKIAVGPNAYQAAFEHLQGRGNADDANAIIRQAVLAAYKRVPVPNPREQAACALLERNLDGWYLPHWLQSLGTLLATPPVQLADVVFTTNFDPLIQVAIERAGGHPRTSVFDKDGRLEQNYGSGSHVIHLHGHWAATDTLHTNVQLRHPRPHLKESLRRVQENKAIVVLGYGGWDDVFSEALSEVLLSGGGKTELLWAFYDSDAANIERQNQKLLAQLKPGHDLGHVTLYRGVNLRELLPQLQQRLLPSTATIRYSAVPSAAVMGTSGTNSLTPPMNARLAPVNTGASSEAGISLAPPEQAPDILPTTTDWSTFSLLRNPGAAFVGRDEELRDLKQGILGSQVRIGVVTGPGGIGKSSVLYRLWRENSTRFRSSLVIDCINSPGAAEIFARISSWLQSCSNSVLAAAMQNDETPIWEKAIVAVQAMEHDGPYLLALDNFEFVLKSRSSSSVPKDKTVAHLLSCLARGLQKSKVLIASRERFTLDAPAGNVLFVPLYDLSAPEAVSLMQRLPRLGRAGTEADYLALWQAGARSPRHIDLIEAELQDYELSAVRAVVESRLHEDMVTDQHLERIYAKLPAAAQVLLRGASVYAEPIFQEMLLVHLPEADKEFHAPLQALLDRSLLNSIDAQIGTKLRKFYRMHETTRQWAAQKLHEVDGRAGTAQAQRRGGHAYLRQLVIDPNQPVLPYVLPAWQLFYKAGDTATASKLALKMANTIQRRIHPDFARAVVVDTLTSVQGKVEHWDLEAFCLQQLSGLDYRQTYYDAALSRLEESLALGRRHGDRRIEAASLSSRSLVEGAKGRLAESRRFATQSLEISKELGEPRCLASSLCAMAHVEHASINIQSATQYYLQAMESIHSCVILPEDLLKQQKLQLDGVSLDAQIFEYALLLLTSADDLGSFADIVGRLCELSVVTLSLGVPSGAREAHLSLLYNACDTLLAIGASQQDATVTSQALALKGLIEQQRGTGGDYRAMLQKSIEISVSLGDWSSVSAKFGMLAEAEVGLGRYAEARPLYRESLAIADKLPTPPKVLTIFLRGRLARIEGLLEGSALARKIYLQALDECTACPGSPELLTALRAGILSSLSELEQKQGQNKETQRWQQERTQLLEDLAAREAAQGNHQAALQIQEYLLKTG